MLEQLQHDLLDSQIPLSDVLRKAYVIGHQLNSHELMEWADRELHGYDNVENLPDYRILPTGCLATVTNGYWKHTGALLPLSSIPNEKLREILGTLYVFDGLRTIEEFAANPDLNVGPSGDVMQMLNTMRLYEGGYRIVALSYAVGNSQFSQILDTVRTRLLKLILSLGGDFQDTETAPPSQEIDHQVQVIIYNSLGDSSSVTNFDQSNQQVGNQYNAVGDINIGRVDNSIDLAAELDKLISEIERARRIGNLSQDVAIEASYHVNKAAKEARKEQPQKDIFVKALDMVKATLENAKVAANLIVVVDQAIEAGKNLLT